MRREFFGGGMYCDNLPTGEWAVYFGSPTDRRIETHAGVIDDCPELLFVRITNQPNFRIAAKTQSPGDVAIWDGAWITDPRISNGVQGHIWRNGVLEVIEPAPHQESMGIRYVSSSGQLVLGSPTYSPATDFAQSLGVKRLYAWTDLGAGIFVGQSDVGGVVFQKAGKHHVLIEGHWEFVQAKRVGDLISIAAYETKRTEARLWWLSASEIDALPLLPPPVHVPDPQPDPEPEPEPDPVPDIPAELNDQVALVKRLRRELFPDRFQPGHPDANPEGYLPLNDGEKAALWAKHLAWSLKQFNVGLATAKPGSPNHGGATPEHPEGFTTDIVALPNGVHWDFQIDGHEGDAFPTWSMQTDPNNYPPVAARWVPAFNPGSAPDPGSPGQPPTQPPGSSTGDLNAAADARAAALLSKLLKPLEARIKALEEQPDAPAPQPFPTRIAIKSDAAEGEPQRGKYGSVQPDGRIVFDRDGVNGSWELFIVEPQ